MKVLDKLFGGIHMSWLKTVLFAIIAGVYTGVINQIPALKGTSFQDIAVTMECWLLFAVIIATNTKSAKESALKVFAFFMISQPIVFLVELPMIGFDLAFMYYKSWFIRILLTLPGGFIAYYAKKENWLGTIILSCATALSGVLGYSYLMDLLGGFPKHLLTVIFCFLQCVVYILVLKKKALYRLVVTGITVAAILVVLFINQGNMNSYGLYLPEGEWTCITEFTDGSSVEYENGMYVYKYNSLRFRDKEIELINDDGGRCVFQIYKNDSGNVTIEPIDGE